MPSHRHFIEFVCWEESDQPFQVVTNASIPRVGEIMDLSAISPLQGIYKVTEVRHIYERKKAELRSPISVVIRVSLQNLEPQNFPDPRAFRVVRKRYKPHIPP